jgi:hypothetical protein
MGQKTDLRKHLVRNTLTILHPAHDITPGNKDNMVNMDGSQPWKHHQPYRPNNTNHMRMASDVTDGIDYPKFPKSTP